MDKTNTNLKVWVRAIRPFSLSASVIPVAIGGIMASKQGIFHTTGFVLSILAIAAFQIGANLINSGDDFINKVDTIESYGSSDVVVRNLLTAKDVNLAGLYSFIIGTLIGLYLAIEGGPTILLLGLIGALGGYFYTKKPFQLKYHGLGVPLIFLLYGPLPVLGAFYLQKKQFGWAPLLSSISLGLLTTAIVHANDIRDMEYDKKAGIKTFSLIIGYSRAARLYIYLIITAYIILLILVCSSIIPVWSILAFATLPLAISNIRKLIGSDKAENLRFLDKDTAKLQMLFGLILIVVIILT